MRRTSTIVMVVVAALLAAGPTGCSGSSDGDPGVGSTSTPTPTEPDPIEPDPTEPDPAEPNPTEPDPTQPTPVEPDPTPTRPDPSGTFPVEPPTSVEPVVDGREIALRDDEGAVRVLHVLDPEGGSTFVAAAARPGGDTDDAVVVALTRAEGTYDLRWTTVEDGIVGPLEVVAPPYAPSRDLVPLDGVEPAVTWVPDGEAVAWVEWGDDGATLRTFGWRDGPGTGDPASDNASFGLAGVPPGARIVRWESGPPSADATTTHVAIVETADGRRWTATLERQADGALAMPP